MGQSGKCDIIIPIWNEYNLTRACMDSIRKGTRYPYRIIAIDNGSEKTTRSYLESCREKIGDDFLIIRNEENLGFIKAVNQGMKASGAPHICVLNNDTLVADGWLTTMVDVMTKNPSMGLLNPLSNTFGQEPKKNEDLNAFAGRIAAKGTSYVEAGQCIGFCMLVSRALVEEIGYLSEDTDFMFFEDTDYSIRARNSGFTCGMAMGAYVYHHEHKSAEKLRVDKDALFAKNQRLFRKKWGRPLRIAYVSSTDFRKDSGEAKKNIEKAISISRKGNYVYLFQKGLFRGDLDNFYGSLGLIRFLNAQIFFKASFFNLYCAWRILTKKRKKRFDAVLVDSAGIYSFLRKVFLLRRTELYCNPGPEDLEKLFRRRHEPR